MEAAQATSPLHSCTASVAAEGDIHTAAMSAGAEWTGAGQLGNSERTGAAMLSWAQYFVETKQIHNMVFRGRAACAPVSARAGRARVRRRLQRGLCPLRRCRGVLSSRTASLRPACPAPLAEAPPAHSHVSTRKPSQQQNSPNHPCFSTSCMHSSTHRGNPCRSTQCYYYNRARPAKHHTGSPIKLCSFMRPVPNSALPSLRP